MSGYENQQVAVPDPQQQLARVEPKKLELALQAAQILSLNPVDVQRFSEDLGCDAVLQTVASGANFFVQYARVVKYMGPETDQPIDPTAGGNAAVEAMKVDEVDIMVKKQPETIRQLGERLWTQMKDQNVAFCLAFTYVAKIFHAGSSTIKSMEMQIKMQEVLNRKSQSDAPVKKANVEKLFNIAEATKHITQLCKDTKETCDNATLFLHNICRTQSLGTRAEALVTEMEECSQKMKDLKTKMEDKKKEEIQHASDEVAETKALEQVNELKSGRLDQKQYLENQKAVIISKLESSESDLKRYTYNMYGWRAYLWENDVKLARANVEKYTAEKSALETKIMNFETDKTKFLDSLNLPEIERRLNAASKSKAECCKQYADLKTSFAELEGKFKELSTELEQICKSNGAVSAKHLTAALKAKHAFSLCAVGTTTAAEVGVASYATDLINLLMPMETLVEADDLETQKAMLDVFKECTQEKDYGLGHMLGSSKALLTLIPATEVIDDEEDVQALTS